VVALAFAIRKAFIHWLAQDLPAKTLFNALGKHFPQNSTLASESRRYLQNNFRAIEYHREWLDKNLPPQEKIIGLYANMIDEDEPGLWLPRGHRTVYCISPGDTLEKLHEKGIHYVVGVKNALYHKPAYFKDFMTGYHGVTLATCPYYDKDYNPFRGRPNQVTWLDQWLYLVRLEQ
jgi:hypothetical protein